MDSCLRRNDKPRLPNSNRLELGSLFLFDPGDPRDFGQPQLTVDFVTHLRLSVIGGKSAQDDKGIPV